MAGVSVGTVSNVLNRPEVVAEPTRRKVLQAIAELGFVRNESGRQLRAGQSRTIAYVMLDAANPFFTDVAKGIEEVARAHGVALFMCNSDSDAAREADYLELLLQQRVRGRAGHAGRPGHLAARRARPPRHPGRARRPWRRRRAGAASASTTSRAAMLAVTHLVEQGHQRIAFVGGPMTTVQVADRLRGRPPGVPRADSPPTPSLVLETAALNVAEGRRAGERLAGLPRAAPTDRRLLRQRPPRPRPAPADDPRSASTCPASWRSSATTTSSSPARPPCRSARCASPASCSGARRPSCCSPRATPTTPTSTSRCCSTRSWSCGRRRSASPRWTRRSRRSASQSSVGVGLNPHERERCARRARRPWATSSSTPAATACTMAVADDGRLDRPGERPGARRRWRTAGRSSGDRRPAADEVDALGVDARRPPRSSPRSRATPGPASRGSCG